MEDGGGNDRLRRKRNHLPPSQASVDEEEEEGDRDRVDGDLSSWTTKRQRARAPLLKSVRAYEEPLEFRQV